MYVCMSICTYVYVCMYVCMYIYKEILWIMEINEDLGFYFHALLISIYVCMYVYMYICVCMYVHIDISCGLWRLVEI